MSLMTPEIMKMMAATMGARQAGTGQPGRPGTLPRPTSNQARPPYQPPSFSRNQAEMQPRPVEMQPRQVPVGMQPRPVGMQPRPAEMQPRPKPGPGSPHPDMSTLQGPSAPPPIPAGILAQLMGAPGLSPPPMRDHGPGNIPGQPMNIPGQLMNVPKQGPGQPSYKVAGSNDPRGYSGGQGAGVTQPRGASEAENIKRRNMRMHNSAVGATPDYGSPYSGPESTSSSVGGPQGPTNVGYGRYHTPVSNVQINSESEDALWRVQNGELDLDTLLMISQNGQAGQGYGISQAAAQMALENYLPGGNSQWNDQGDPWYYSRGPGSSWDF